jgi:hypothetical protein
MSEIKVDTVVPRTNPSTLTIGAAGDTVNIVGTAGTGFPSTTINNNADNKVITGSGTANTLEAETNLTYDGTDLVLTSGSANSNALTVKNTADAITGIEIQKSDYAIQLVVDHGNAGAKNFAIRRESVDGSTSRLNYIVCEEAGEVTKPQNPAFRVYQSTQTTYANNHTMYNQNITEVYDVNGNYGTSFTAPVTGKYLFTASFYDVTASDAQTYDMMLTTSNRGYRWGNRNAYKSGYTGYGGNMKGEGTIIADMDAADTAYVACGSSGNVDNGSNSEHSYFSGILIG